VSQAITAADRERPAYLIESVDGALRLLHMFLVSERIRVAEAGTQLGVAASIANRLLAMLPYHGCVTQDRRTHEYLAGPDLIRFGLAAAKQVDFHELARPVLEALSAEVIETVHLGIIQGGDVLYIESIEGRPSPHRLTRRCEHFAALRFDGQGAAPDVDGALGRDEVRACEATRGYS
jgi:DNA-binding IclR family transcriptional regulator